MNAFIHYRKCFIHILKYSRKHNYFHLQNASLYWELHEIKDILLSNKKLMHANIRINFFTALKNKEERKRTIIY